MNPSEMEEEWFHCHNPFHDNDDLSMVIDTETGENIVICMACVEDRINDVSN